MGSRLPPGLRRSAPTRSVVTDYDRSHFKQYIQLLDAQTSAMDQDEMCRLILGIDPEKDRESAYRTLKSHVDRAVWMTKIGYRLI